MADNPKLTVLFEKLRGKTFELDKELMTCGRKEEMDICVKDGSLSSHHCDFIRTEDGNYILRDNDSTNGTRVNNAVITELQLKNSDIIQLGGVEILYDSPTRTGNSGGTLRTHTIEIDDTKSNLSTVRGMSNFSPFAQRNEQKQKRTHLIVLISLAGLALAVIALIILVLKMLKVF